MKPTPRQPDKLSRRYVDFDKGWRPFFLGLLIAAVLGLGFRLYFSPARLKSWVAAAVQDQKKKTNSHFAFAFDSAELRLSRGWQPQFAVVLKGVKVAPAPDCRPEPSLQISELSLPLRVLPLVTKRKFSVGIVSAEGMTVDLDGLKDRCVAKAGSAGNSSESMGGASESATVKSSDKSSDEVPPWWDDARVAQIETVVEGIDFSNVDIVFEKKSKHLFLDSLRAEVTSSTAARASVGESARAATIDIATEVRIPPETSFGEKMPPLLIEGTVTSRRADVKISARVDEGEIEASAILTPQADKSLAIDAALGIGDLPLSTIVPLMRKVGLAGDRFQPKFLWMNCSAKIKGTFQRVFDHSPLYLDGCSLEGDGTKLTLAQATRLPNGTWEPFTIRVEALDLGKFLKTVSAQGPDGISNQFGRVRGEIAITSAKEASFKGKLQSAELSFSSGRVRAHQGLDTADLSVTFDGDRFRGAIENVALRDGEAKGRVDLEFERGLRKGTIRASLDRILFSPEVQSLLVHGKLGAMSGAVETKIEGGLVESLTSKIKFASTSGRDLRFDSVALEIELRGLTADDKASGHASDKSAALTWFANGFELHAKSRYFEALKPVFLTHEFDSDWVPLENLKLESQIARSGLLTWKDIRATVERDQISIRSEGSMTRERQLAGEIEVDFPKVKNLKWTLSGSTALPILSESSKSLKDLKERVELDDQTLGLVKRR